MKKEDSVSLIVPTLNRGPVLLDLLRNINELTWVAQRRPLQVVIVDQSDVPVFEESGYPTDLNFTLTYEHITVRGLPNARNVALTKATGDYLVFIDDDVVLDPHFIEEHIGQFSDAAIGAVAGRVVEDSFIKKVAADTPDTMYGINDYGKYYPLRGGNSRNFVLGFPGGNFSVRRSIVTQIGKFDTRYAGTSQLEETDYAYRIRKAGYKILFNPAAVLLHLRVPSGGCRVPTLFEKRYWRCHNTTLFFHLHKKKALLPLMMSALATGGLAEMLQRKYSLKHYLFSLKGFYHGYKKASQ